VVVSSDEFRLITSKLTKKGPIDYSTLMDFQCLPWTPGMVNQELPSGRKSIMAEFIGYGWPSVREDPDEQDSDYMAVRSLGFFNLHKGFWGCLHRMISLIWPESNGSGSCIFSCDA